MPPSDPNAPTPRDRPSAPLDPREPPGDPSEDERPAGTVARMLLVGAPFAFLAILYALDRLIRG